jgi:hypothetical protein
VADHDGHLDAEPGQGLDQEVGLMLSRPHAALGPVAVAVARSVEGEDRVVAGHPIQDAAHDPVLVGHDVAVDEHHRWPIAFAEVMQPHAIDVNELAGRWVLLLGPACPVGVVNGHSPECRC